MLHLDNHFNSEFKLTRKGLIISTEHPFLAASPDALLVTEEEGTFVVEVKCPYSYKDSALDVAAFNEKFPLRYSTEEDRYAMRENHEYYYQIQLQMFVTGLKFGYFVVYTNCDLIYVKVEYDQQLMDECIPKVKKYWIHVIVPEMLIKYFTSPPAPVYNNENMYFPCICQKVEPTEVKVVNCSGDNCRLKVFHVKCIGVKKPTKAWKCQECKKKMSKNRREALKDVSNKRKK